MLAAMPARQHEIEAAAAELRAAADARDAALERAWQKLRPALEHAADILVELSVAEWDALRHEELTTAIATSQFVEAFGLPTDPMPPETTLGEKILELLAQRHPLFIREPEGAA